jgi:hypothetical protein
MASTVYVLIVASCMIHEHQQQPVCQTAPYLHGVTYPDYDSCEKAGSLLAWDANRNFKVRESFRAVVLDYWCEERSD